MGALAGLRVMVPVTAGRRELADALWRAGAEALEVEWIAIRAAADADALERAVREWCAGEYAWLAVTSRNAVAAMDAAARTLGASLAAPSPQARVAVVGDATRAVCESIGLAVDLVPETATGRGLAAAFPVGDARVLIPLGDRASPVLAAGIAAKGWDVTSVEAYRTVAGEGPTAAQVASLASGQVDAVVLTSGFMAARLAEAWPTIPASTTMVAIGPSTAAAAAAAGLRVTELADRPTYEALIEALCRSTEGKAP